MILAAIFFNALQEGDEDTALLCIEIHFLVNRNRLDTSAELLNAMQDEFTLFWDGHKNGAFLDDKAEFLEDAILYATKRKLGKVYNYLIKMLQPSDLGVLLFQSVMLDDAKLVTQLLEMGVDANSEDEIGCPALTMAIAEKRTLIAKILLQHKASVIFAGGDGLIEFHKALSGDAEVEELLLASIKQERLGALTKPSDSLEAIKTRTKASKENTDLNNEYKITEEYKECKDNQELSLGAVFSSIFEEFSQDHRGRNKAVSSLEQVLGWGKKLLEIKKFNANASFLLGLLISKQLDQWDYEKDDNLSLPVVQGRFLLRKAAELGLHEIVKILINDFNLVPDLAMCNALEQRIAALEVHESKSTIAIATPSGGAGGSSAQKQSDILFDVTRPKDELVWHLKEVLTVMKKSSRVTGKQQTFFLGVDTSAELVRFESFLKKKGELAKLFSALSLKEKLKKKGVVPFQKQSAPTFLRDNGGFSKEATRIFDGALSFSEATDSPFLGGSGFSFQQAVPSFSGAAGFSQQTQSAASAGSLSVPMDLTDSDLASSKKPPVVAHVAQSAAGSTSMTIPFTGFPAASSSEQFGASLFHVSESASQARSVVAGSLPAPMELSGSDLVSSKKLPAAVARVVSVAQPGAGAGSSSAPPQSSSRVAPHAVLFQSFPPPMGAGATASSAAAFSSQQVASAFGATSAQNAPTGHGTKRQREVLIEGPSLPPVSVPAPPGDDQNQAGEERSAKRRRLGS